MLQLVKNKCNDYFFVLLLTWTFCVISTKARENQDKLRDCLEKRLQENEECMSHIATFSRKVVSRNWLEQYAPEVVTSTLRPVIDEMKGAKKAIEEHASEWAIAPVGKMTQIEEVNKHNGITTQQGSFSIEKELNKPAEIKTPESISNIDWVTNCNEKLEKDKSDCKRLYDGKEKQ